MTFHLMYVHIIFSSVSVAEWQPFGEIAAHFVDHMLPILTICNISYFHEFFFLVLG